MDALLEEQANLANNNNLSDSIDKVQDCIDRLSETRNSITAGQSGPALSAR